MKETTEHTEKMQNVVDDFFNASSSKKYLNTLDELFIFFTENTAEYNIEYRENIISDYKNVKQLIEDLTSLVSQDFINSKKDLLMHKINNGELTGIDLA